MATLSLTTVAEKLPGGLYARRRREKGERRDAFSKETRFMDDTARLLSELQDEKYNDTTLIDQFRGIGKDLA